MNFEKKYIDQLEELIQRTKCSNTLLDNECSDEHLHQLSGTISQGHSYAHALGLSQADIEEIDLDLRVAYSSKARMARYLLKWKSLQKLKESLATYRYLALVALSLRDGITARDVCTLCVPTTNGA